MESDPMVWRRLRIAADTSLAALHFVQIVQGWGDDHAPSISHLWRVQYLRRRHRFCR
ncbi:hypothetical protein [Klebsiella pneumoniae]|uniref:hypothetical protein n=1 Tax=Klebsiella pneumoniae TaxID=573 RepID=UPI003970D1AE